MSKPPRHIGVVLSALRLKGGRAEELRSLDDPTWRELLAYTDSTHLTLYLAARARDFAPGWVRQRLAKNLSDNSRRFERIKAAYGEMAYTFRKAGVNHVVLKGFSQWPDYSEDLRLRLQSDIDFYCPPESIFQARDLLVGLGYKEVPTSSFADHLPIMIREGGWQWKGNYYDPDIPPMVELHHRLWNRERLRFGPSSLGWRAQIHRRHILFQSRRRRPTGALVWRAGKLLRRSGSAQRHRLKSASHGDGRRRCCPLECRSYSRRRPR